MRLPGWLRGGSGPDPGSDDDEREPGRKPNADSERAQRERLAKARRERARRARAELAAKARGSDGDTGEEEKPAKGSGAPKKRAPPAAKGTSRPPRSRGGEKKRAGALRKGAGPGRSRGTSSGDRAKRIGAGVGPAVVRSAKGARARATKLAPRIAHGALRTLLVLFGIFFDVLAFVLNVAIAIWRFAAGPLRAAIDRLARLTNAASRALTPARALTLAAAGAIVLLALSQFADYRSISIGNDSYADGIQTVAPAPVKETDATGSAHSYAMVPVAAVSLLLLGAAMGGRWRACRLIALAGLVAIAVGLLHDRPTGLDPGDSSVAYEGVKATLIGGFYAQLAAGLLLTASSLLLGRELRPADATRPARSTRRSRVPRRRFRLRRRAGVEGARA